MRKGPGSVTTSRTYPWSFVTQIFHSGQPGHGSDCKTFEVTTSTLPRGTLGSVASLLIATLYQGNPDRNHIHWNIVSTERYILHILECCYILMESSQWENWNHNFCRKVLFLTAPHCQFRGIGQGIKQTYLYLCYLVWCLLNRCIITIVVQPLFDLQFVDMSMIFWLFFFSCSCFNLPFKIRQRRVISYKCEKFSEWKNVIKASLEKYNPSIVLPFFIYRLTTT